MSHYSFIQNKIVCKISLGIASLEIYYHRHFASRKKFVPWNKTIEIFCQIWHSITLATDTTFLCSIFIVNEPTIAWAKWTLYHYPLGQYRPLHLVHGRGWPWYTSPHMDKVDLTSQVIIIIYGHKTPQTQFSLARARWQYKICRQKVVNFEVGYLKIKYTYPTKSFAHTAERSLSRPWNNGFSRFYWVHWTVRTIVDLCPRITLHASNCLTIKKLVKMRTLAIYTNPCMLAVTFVSSEYTQRITQFCYNCLHHWTSICLRLNPLSGSHQ